jgi:hypothetical protein
MSTLLRYTPFVVLVMSLVALLTQVVIIRRQLFIQNFLTHSKEFRLLTDQFPIGVTSDDYDINQGSAEERDRAFRPFFSYFDICFDKFYLRQRRLIPKRLWGNWERGMLMALRLPAFRQNWKAFCAITSYDEEFVAFVNRLIEQATTMNVAVPRQAGLTPQASHDRADPRTALDNRLT